VSSNRRVVAVAVATTCAAVLLTFVSGCANGPKLHVSGTGAPKAAGPGQRSASATAQPAADGVQQIVINTTDDDRFKPDVVFAHPGTLRITITNPSLLPHSFILPTLSVQSETIFAGKSVVVTVELKDTGSYPFECGFHKHQGMVGQLIVS
jgi:plastocyanin